MNFKNSKQFIQTLEEFDKTQKKMDGFPDRTSMKSRFYSLADEITDTKAYNWWRKVPIVLLIIIVEFLILWYMLIHNVKGIEGGIIIFMATFMTGFNLIHNNRLQEAYIRRKNFARQLLSDMITDSNHYNHQKKENEVKRSKALVCQNPMEYYPKYDFADYMSNAVLISYWKEKTLPKILSECDKSDEYIESSLARIVAEREFLKGIINYDN